jgi:molecular chaperone HtpG
MDKTTDDGAGRPISETLSFQAEVSRLLHLMVHSVYSEKEIFLRELISNASDACDRLRYQALTEPHLLGDDAGLEVVISFDKQARTLTVADNGIGMDRDELIANLGTIARSGTSAFVDQLSGDAAKDVSLIGKFGVGFYSAFMVAERVDVTSRKAGADLAWRWTSDGLGAFEVAPADKAGRGTEIVLHLRKGEDEWLEPARLKRVVKTYSDHIALPVKLRTGAEATETLNEAAALWTRPKSEITEQQYAEFYRHVGHAFDAPWATFHFKAEGKIEYTGLLFVPEERPFDLFDPRRQHRVKLYVRRVFITDDCEGLLPGYLRFLKGVVDTQDLPLNISREMLQNNPLIAKIRQAITKRVLTELEKRAEKDAEGYAKFWSNFGAVLKEGIYEDGERREQLLKLARFRTTKSGGDLVSLADYVVRMKPNQTAIYTITGDDVDTIRRSPQLEGFAARDVEVLLLSDAVDDFWLSTADGFDGKPFRSVTRGGADLDAIAPAENAAEPDDGVRDAEIGTLVALLKQTLGEAIADVRPSSRLTDSAVCLVAADGALDMHLARMLRSQRAEGLPPTPRVLEINPRHALVRGLARDAAQPGAADRLADAAHLLLDQARIVEGEPLPDPAGFSHRLAAMMAKGYGL